MPDRTRRLDEASDEKVYLYASDPHRVIAARAQAERVRRERERPAEPVKGAGKSTRYAKRAAILGAAAMGILAVYAAIATFRGQP